MPRCMARELKPKRKPRVVPMPSQRDLFEGLA
jgi:hypothetical protein